MATTSLLPNTHLHIDALKARGGFSDEQATAIVEIINEVDISQVATKADLTQLKTELKAETYKLVGANLAAVVAIGVAFRIFG